MRKWLCFVLAAVLCIVLAGCQVAALQETPTPTEEEIPTTTTTTVCPISREKALAMAEAHFGIKVGTNDPQTGFMMSYGILHEPTADEPYWTVALQWLVEVDGKPSHQSVLDTLTIMSYDASKVKPSE